MQATSPQLIAGAVNARPITSKQGLLEHLFKLSFGGFVYNQIWEDPDVDAQALELDSNSKIMTISSGGCNVLNYLAKGVASVDAVDLNQNHLQLLNLKLVALAHFPSHDDFFAFFGNANHADNVRRYENYLRPHLDAAAIEHWEGGRVRRSLRRERFRYFERGLYKYASMGAFLRFMNGVARRKGMEPSRLLECKSLEEQEDVFDREIAPFFDMKVVKGMCKLPFLLHGLGVPPRQFQTFKNEAVDGSLLSEYRLRVKRLACDFPIQDNYFAWQAFGGRYDHHRRQAIPEYLKRENFDRLKENVWRVKTHLTSMTEFLNRQSDNSLNRFVMLDAQDWMEPHQIEELWREIARVGEPGTRIIFRSGASGSPVEEALPPDLAGRFAYHREVSSDFFKRDRSAIYGGFHLYSLDN